MIFFFLCFIFLVRLSLASCGVKHRVTSVWCQVSWCLHCCKATLTHMYVQGIYTQDEASHTREYLQYTYLCDMRAQMRADSIMALKKPPDQTGEAFLPNNWRKSLINNVFLLKANKPSSLSAFLHHFPSLWLRECSRNV